MARFDKSPELAQALLRCAGTGIYIVQNGKFRYVNPLFVQLTGYSESELLGKYSLGLVHPEDREEVRRKATDSLKGGSSVPYEYRFAKKSGEIIWVLEKVTSTEFKGKRAVVGSFLNITEIKRAEEALANSQALYRSVVETGGAGILTGDLNGNVVFVNEAFCKMVGYSFEELVGKPFVNFVHPDDKPMIMENFAEGLIHPEKDFHLEFRAIRKDGRTVWFYPSVSPIFHQGNLTSGMAIIFDITERKVLEEALKKSEERYRTILEEIQDNYFETDLDGNFIFVNDSMSRILGYPKEKLIGVNYRTFAAKEDAEVVYRDFNRVFRTGETMKGLAYKFVDRYGNVGYNELSVSAIKDDSGKVIAFRGIARDVTERKRMERELNDIASHDFLTGLPNRMLLNDRLNMALATAKRNKSKLVVMMLDLDRFKVVNDTYGHSIGDTVLRIAGERLVALVRKSDTVARVGGDEFLILLPKISRVEDCVKVARKILEAFREPLTVNSYKITVTTSVGFSVYPEDGQDSEALLKNADIAMYWVKEQGRDNYASYSIGKVNAL
ncbi:MAG TPA: PAS domain S-box protein [Dehalococcoidia bacterium]|jgi:diguanylate cyclase (GGDEF)-like protein/PAS domain S-box-containing protein